jgi:class 3 adenylate cyclase
MFKRSAAFLIENDVSTLTVVRFVADELKAGRSVAPQMYDSASLYFSDIAGFTHLSSESTPLEVVDLLNDLYSLFDDTLAKYDVYKVRLFHTAVQQLHHTMQFHLYRYYLNTRAGR